ncbi:MAG: HAD-IC family P-type ATPase [Flammeovirgaceae bacterium]|nr:HAD-IC family P-type ATPase [Flammeovirgaceae bacterium]
MNVKVASQLRCYHCGDTITTAQFKQEEKSFCCFGCQTVYQILKENDLCEYYSFDSSPGINNSSTFDVHYDYLDEPTVQSKLLQFNSPNFARVQFAVPAIHCVSCIWLLENLNRIDEGVLLSKVNFGKRTVTIDYNPERIALSKIANRLTSLGYKPVINLQAKQDQHLLTHDKNLILKIAIAGFCFGNIMLFSFPEYFGLGSDEGFLRDTFSYLNILLAIPVLFYSASDYFTAARRAVLQKQINIDVPIAIGLIALFTRSLYDIGFHVGPGYLDSLVGLVFFLLLGRWFQSKTYASLSFDRDYTSYFPLAILTFRDQKWTSVLLSDLQPGDTIRIRNQEIIPADSILESEFALINYSFVTGESTETAVRKGENIFAGGKLIGKPATFIVHKSTSQSHLTSLWNNDIFQKADEQTYQRTIDRTARIFTWIILFIAAASAAYWFVADSSKMWLVLTSVLIIACPCALALSAPFTYGSMLRVFGKYGLYLKNADVVERLSSISTVVFDKTGTLTSGVSDVSFSGELSEEEKHGIALLTAASIHPLSVLISKSISTEASGAIENFEEFVGEGVEGIVNGCFYKIGSAQFVGAIEIQTTALPRVYVSINNEMKGYYSLNTSLRKGVGEMLDRMKNINLSLVSGDGAADKKRLTNLFPKNAELKFNQSVHDKLNHIKGLQQDSAKVMMVGDGLNDSGALKQSDVGLVVTDDTGVFTPASDGIIHGKSISNLDKFIELGKSATFILKLSFIISFIYNSVGLSFAVTGHLTPLVAAILMPLSSISVVAFATASVNYVAYQKRMLL